MSIIEKVFKYEVTELPVIKYEDEIWFKAVVVATILKYTNQSKAIRDLVDPEDKRKLSELMSKSKRNKSFHLKTDPLILKEMCIYISMSIIEKVFKYEGKEITVIKCRDKIWFRGKDIAKALGYEKTRNAILKHVNDDDKSILEELRRGPQIRAPFKNEQGGSIFINESGLYSLIFGSKLESAKVFKRWVTSEVLPSIRKTGRYDYCMNHKYNNMLTFKIENKTDLHVKVVSFLKKRYPHSLFTVTLGENQGTAFKRIDSFKKGYLRGSPDLIINNLHKHYTGFCIEFKNPNGKGILSPDQSMMLRQYQNNGFKILVSNDYDQIIEQIIEYFRDVRIKCSYCPRRFISPQSLRNHIEFFHKM